MYSSTAPFPEKMGHKRFSISIQKIYRITGIHVSKCKNEQKQSQQQQTHSQQHVKQTKITTTAPERKQHLQL